MQSELRTTRMLVFIVTVILQCIPVLMAQVVTTVTARRRSNFDNRYIPDSRLLWTKTERHVTYCVGECGRDTPCVSVFFNKDSGKCQGHSTTFGVIGDSLDEPNTMFYVLPRGEKYIGDSCTDTSDCITPNSQCFSWTGTCLCNLGYSLKPSTYQCLPDCAVYGEDFMEIKNFYISGVNRETFVNTNFADCKALCRSRTGYVCRSIEYQWSSQKCFLTNVTYAHHPDRWYGDHTYQFNISYFQRDCEQ